jgi:hypothetical protein
VQCLGCLTSAPHSCPGFRGLFCHNSALEVSACIWPAWLASEHLLWARPYPMCRQFTRIPVSKFVGKETEAQRGAVTCPRSHSKEEQSRCPLTLWALTGLVYFLTHIP